MFAIQFLNPAYSSIEITNQEKTEISDSVISTQKPTINTMINLEEKPTKFRFNEVTLSIVKKPQITKTIFVTEKMTMTNTKDGETSLHLIKKENNLALLDRIFGKRKDQLDNVIGISQYTGPIDLSFDDAPMQSDDGMGVYRDTNIESLWGISLALTNHVAALQPSFYNLISVDIDDLSIIGPQLELIQKTLHPTSPVLFIFALSACYLIIRSEDHKIKIQSYRQILCLAFVVILLSSTVTIPLSISDSYYAYAQEAQDSLEAMGSSSTSFGPQEPASIDTEESTTLEPVMPLELIPDAQPAIENIETVLELDTQTIPATNSTQTIPATNSTQTIPATNSTQTIPATNSTQTIPATNSTQTIILAENLNLDDVFDITIIPTTPIWDSVNGSELIGDVFVNETGIILDGGFVKSNTTETNSTSLSITAWIKPDYTSGSSTFTIISKEGQFKFTLNNILDPQQIASFSIFDGIKWHSIEGNDKLGSGWSHIGASFNGSDISIFTNGTLSKSEKIKSLNTTTGLVEEMFVQIPDSNADIIVGASLDSRTVDTGNALFSGKIDELQIYDKHLTEEQIFQIYNQMLATKLTNPIINATIPTIELAPINLLNNTSFNGTLNINGTLNANATQIITAPQVNVTNELTITAWVDPDYSAASDEMTIVSKEKSFVLSINNILEPTHVAKFSVFDGFKWTDIFGLDEIQSTSHLAAVINGTEIMLYVNGTKQNNKILDDIFEITEHRIQPRVGGVADSDSQVIIGAYQSTLRSEPKLENKFAGIIDTTTVYPRALSADEIRLMYNIRFAQNHNLDLLESIDITEDYVKLYNVTGIQDVNQTDIMLDTNKTSVDIIADPTLTQTKPSYLINEEVEFQLEYYDESEILLMQIAELENTLAELIEEQETDNSEQIDTNPTNNVIVLPQTNSTSNDITTSVEQQANSTDAVSSQNNTAIDPIGYLIAAFLPFADAEQTEKDAVLEQIVQTKQKLKQLREKLVQTKQNNTVVSDLKDEIKEISNDLTIINQNVTDSVLPERTDDLNEYLNTTETVKEVQYEIWQQDNSTITTQIYSPQGQLIQTSTKYEKLRDGKFNIKLNPEQIITPGVYKIATILQVDDQQFVVYGEFAWGLVSLNTKKSIYKPGEIANLEIVVLDNEGHPVCDANISLIVTDPLLNNQTLTSHDGIIPNEDCGVYDAKYQTSLEGTHQIEISATTPSGITTFETDFAVKSLYEYDIIRTAQSKIDPITNPNSFAVKIDIESFVGGQQVTIREFVPAQLNVTTDGLVQEINGTKIIAWTRNLDQNKTSVSYEYSIPLEFPRLYALGKMEIKQENVAFTEARNWYVAADPPIISNDDAFIAYGSSAASSRAIPKIRAWTSDNKGTWGNEVELPTTGSNIEFVELKYSPAANRLVLITSSADDNLDAYVCDGNCTTSSNWSVTNNIGAATSVSAKKFDFAFESATGDAILVYSLVSTNASRDLAYRILPAGSTTWGSEQYINDSTEAADVQYTWLDVARDPISNSEELTLVGFDNTNDDVNAWVWNGNSWGNQQEITNAATDPATRGEGQAVEYESDGGNAIVLAGSGASGNIVNATWNGSTWSVHSGFDPLSGTLDLQWVTLKADPNSDDVMAVLQYTGSDLATAYWDGRAWTAIPTSLAGHDNAVDNAGTRVADFAWMPTLNRGILAWETDGTGTNVEFVVCSPKCTATQQSNATYSGTGRWMSLYTNYDAGDSNANILGIRLNSVNVLSGFRINFNLNATTYGDGSITTNTQTSTFDLYSLAFRNQPKYAALSENLGFKDTIRTTLTKSLSEKLGFKDTIVKTPTKTLSEKLGLKDIAGKTQSKTLSEKLGFKDTIVKTPTKTLSEKLGLKDNTQRIKTKLVLLSEKLGFKDTIVKTPTKTLSEKLGFQDIAGKTQTKRLTENLGFTDNTARTPTKILSENLGFTDNTARTATKTLSENLGFTDNTARTATKRLTENLGFTDNTARTPTKILSENLGFTDNTARTATKTLSENLGFTDNTARTATKRLTENLGFTDNTARTPTKILSENLGFTDNTARTATKTLSENLGFTDNTARTATKRLTENLGFTDTITRTTVKSLTEKLGFKDTIAFKGGWEIEARNTTNALIGGATYRISPNPNGGSSAFIVTDNDSNDLDSTVGRVGFSQAPLGTYNITMTIIPSAYNVLGNSTMHEVHATNIHGTSVFRVALQSSSLSQLAPTVITTAPMLNSTTYTAWTSTFSATIVNGSSTTTINAVNQLPPIVSVGNATSQLSDAITKQASIRLSTSFTSQTSGQTIINSLGVQNYTVSTSPFTTSVIPSMVTAPSGTSSQFVATPPLTGFVPGQAVVVPVETSLLPSYGGLVQLSVDAADGSSSIGNAKNDWFVVETASTIPSTLGTSGISNDRINLFVDVSYQYEISNKGFNWSVENNFATKPTLTLRVAKSSTVESDANGCPIMTAYTLNRATSTWIQTGISITTPSSVNSNSCDVILSTPHFSEFALSSKTKASTSSGASTSGGDAGGSGGGGGTSGGSIGTVGAPGTVANPIVLYQAQYDVCDRNMVRIIAGVYGSEAPPPHVKIRTPDREVYSATLAKDQPYLEHNKILQVSRYVYEAPINRDLKYFVITAEQVNGRIATSTSYLVNIYGCSDTIIINPMTDLDKIRVDTVVEEGRPNIFDVKFQIESGKPVPSTAVNQYIQGNEKVTVTGIIDSQTELRRAELRVVTGGNNYTDYAAVKMDVAPLAGVANTYIVSAELPTTFLQTPAIIYWIHVVNQEEKIQASEKYYLGVKPTYPLDARLELDTPIAKSQGSTLRPSAYVYNEGKPLFGSVSLLVNGKVEFTSSEYVFKDITAIDLAWNVPELDSQTSYDIKARLNLYDKEIDTGSTTVNTFKSTKSYSISDVINVQSIVDEQQKLVARAGLLYSSDANPNLHYRVVSPDGKCVIGDSDSCMVKHSTLGKRGNAESIEIDGQIFRVRYSGQNSPLERFSITSVDPIEGVWSVSLESDSIVPEAHASEDTQIKIKYRTLFAKPITLTSDYGS